MTIHQFISIVHIPLYWSITLFFASFLFSLRAKKKNNYILRAIGGIFIVSLIQSGVILFCNWFENLFLCSLPFTKTTFSLTFFISEVVLLLLFLLFTCSIKLKEALFFTVASYSLEHFANAFKSIVVYAITTISGTNLNKIVSIFVFDLALKLLIIFLVYFFILKKYLDKYRVKEIVDNKVLSISFINLAICMVLSVYKTYSPEGTTNGFTTNVICSCYAIFGCALCLYLQFAYFIEMKLANDNRTLDILIKEQNKGNEVAKENIDLINIKFHDLKKQLRRLEETGIAGNEETLKEIHNTLSVYDSYVRTGNSAIDSVLMTNYLSCLKSKVDFTYFVDGESINFMKSEDIIPLFDNLFDNAMDAVNQEEEKNRIIHFEVYKEKEMLVIHMRNYSSRKPKFQHGIPQTSKDSRYHGYGMKSIERIVQNYNGIMNISWKDCSFNVNILLPIVKTVE
ncbi:MAG: ATP-binding protein [Bacilli bacterium]|nr:ATP-binding protein [Bacilli bacterium]